MKFKPKAEDTRNFLKLKAGESVIGIFQGDPYDFRIHWHENRSILCPGEAKCDLCKAGEKSKFSFRVNFVVKDGNDYAAKIWQGSWTFYETLRSLDEGDYKLNEHVMKITRQGERLNTSYMVLPVPNVLVTAEMKQKLKEVPLNSLLHTTESETEVPHNEEIPF